MRDIFTEETVRAALGDCADLMQVMVLPQCDSTNAVAKRTAAGGVSHPVLITAESQTAGRGRLGRQFHSPRGTGIYLSVLFPLEDAPTSVVGVTCASAVAVMRAIRSTAGLQTGIKWVNDLYLGGKKVCGILAEVVSTGERNFLIVGIGVNLRPAEFPEELTDKAGSLNDEQTPRCVLVAEIVRELLPFLRDPRDRSWLEEYRRYSCVIGKRICWSRGDELHEGVAESIDRDGGLTVRGEDGIVSVLRTGEISVKTLYTIKKDL